MLRLILKETSLLFNGKNYLQIHGTTMGTKMAVSFANLFMAAVETEILNASTKIVLSEVKFEERKSALLQKIRAHNKILPFVTKYHPAVTKLKKILLSKWHLIENHPLLSEIYKYPPIISYRRGKSLKDILVRSKL